jgi:putative lipoic acid-binding regulatory protein
MKHVLEKMDSFGCNHKITVIERTNEKFTSATVEIIEEYKEDEMPKNEVLKASFTFREKKDLSSFIGVLLHVQSKMK